ncbi:MAG: S49 family peptidase [Dehalococcoidales bacterium]|nr:S49 family peptidase [Dehalococcoidales bacterium]
MSRLESFLGLLRRWFTSIPFFILLGLVLGYVIAIPAIPRPKIATIVISGTIFDQVHTDEILQTLREVNEDASVKAVVLEIDSPGGSASAVEQIYLDTLRLRQKKPVVTSVGTVAASGGYYIAVATDYIYAHPSSQLGSIGAFVLLPEAEQVDEEFGATGPFKEIGRSKRTAFESLEMVRQGFAGEVVSQRGERLHLAEEEISQARVYLGIESLRYGLIDAIGTKSDALEKAASLAGLRRSGNYEVERHYIAPRFFFLTSPSSSLDELKSRISTFPMYYYLHLELE